MPLPVHDDGVGGEKPVALSSCSLHPPSSPSQRDPMRRKKKQHRGKSDCCPLDSEAGAFETVVIDLLNILRRHGGSLETADGGQLISTWTQLVSSRQSPK